MTTTARTALKASLAQDVPCPRCEQGEDQQCRTPTGRPRPNGQEHADRWEALHAAYALPRRYVLVQDDPDFGLTGGDVLVCEPYWLDRGKLTVLYRESDRFDPQCNVYRQQVTRVRGAAGRVEATP